MQDTNMKLIQLSLFVNFQSAWSKVGDHGGFLYNLLQQSAYFGDNDEYNGNADPIFYFE